MESLIFYAVAVRQDIGDFLGARRVATRVAEQGIPEKVVRNLGPRDCTLIWSRDPRERLAMPDVIVTAEGAERDWLAWIASFAQSYRPFTAYCRVEGSGSFMHRLNGGRKEPDLGRVEGACIGLILGEILSSDDVLSRMRDMLPASASASTLSFVLSRALAIYSGELHWQVLVDRWRSTRVITRQRGRSLDSSAVVDVFGLLTSLGNEASVAVDDSVQRALLEMLSGEGVLRRWSGSDLMLKFDLEHETREARVAKFEAALQAVLASQPQDGAFVLGYLASRISPGTLVHAPMLAPTLARYPAAMLWYGVCAGIADPNGVLNAFGGLGRRALRELYAPHGLLEKPRCDLAWDELEILLRERPDDPPEFIAGAPNQLTVELSPSIGMVVNWSRYRAGKRAEDKVGEERAWLTQEVGATLVRLHEVYMRLKSDVEPEKERSQVDRAEVRNPAGQGLLPLGAATKPERRGRKR